MNNLIIHNNEIYMKVKPVESLLKSNLIRDVVQRGDTFAVKMSTGELTVIGQPDRIFEDGIYYQEIGNNSIARINSSIATINQISNYLSTGESSSGILVYKKLNYDAVISNTINFYDSLEYINEKIAAFYKDVNRYKAVHERNL